MARRLARLTTAALTAGICLAATSCALDPEWPPASIKVLNCARKGVVTVEERDAKTGKVMDTRYFPTSGMNVTNVCGDTTLTGAMKQSAFDYEAYSMVGQPSSRRDTGIIDSEDKATAKPYFYGAGSEAKTARYSVGAYVDDELTFLSEDKGKTSYWYVSEDDDGTYTVSRSMPHLPHASASTTFYALPGGPMEVYAKQRANAAYEPDGLMGIKVHNTKTGWYANYGDLNHIYEGVTRKVYPPAGSPQLIFTAYLTHHDFLALSLDGTKLYHVGVRGSRLIIKRLLSGLTGAFIDPTVNRDSKQYFSFMLVNGTQRTLYVGHMNGSSATAKKITDLTGSDLNVLAFN